MDLRLHNEVITNFKEQFFTGVLTTDHLIPKEITINKIKYTNGTVDDEYNFWGYELVKDNVHYLLPSEKDRDVLEELPIKINPDHLVKASSSGQVYFIIEEYQTVRFKGVRSRSYKEFIDSIADGLPSTNPKHRKLFLMMCLAQLMGRAYFRVATNKGFGKDSTVDLLGELFSSAMTIETPTRAKLELLILVTNLLAINEVMSVTSRKELELIEGFVQQAAAHKMSITKHSRASSGTKEVLPANKFSLSLFYNDLPHYSRRKQEKYLDFSFAEQTLDRLPAFRLWGRFTADFNELSQLRSLEDFVKEHFDEFKQWIYDFTYYKENKQRELKRWQVNGLRKMAQRWERSVSSLLQQLDMYCDTQEEFDEWIQVVNRAMQDYEDMLIYPESVRVFADKLGIPKLHYEKYTKTSDIIQYYKIKDPKKQDSTMQTKLSYCKQIDKEPTFTGKLILMREYSDKPKIGKDLSQW